MSEKFTIGTPKEAASIEKGYFESIIDISPTLVNYPPGASSDRGNTAVRQASDTLTHLEPLLHSDSFSGGTFGPYDDDGQG
jgi:hypothetical protein